MKADDIFKAKETNNEHARTRMLGVVSTQKKANKPMSNMCVQSQARFPTPLHKK